MSVQREMDVGKPGAETKHRAIDACFEDGFADRFWGRVCRPGANECWTWTGYRMPRGYGRVSCGGAHVYTHRVAFYLSTGIDPGDLDVLHHCDNPPCVNPAHLYIGTLQDNMRDRTVRERGNTRKLTAAEVREIRAMLGRAPQKTIAERFGVSMMTISRIARRKIWRHVGE